MARNIKAFDEEIEKEDLENLRNQALLEPGRVQNNYMDLKDYNSQERSFIVYIPFIFLVIVLIYLFISVVNLSGEEGKLTLNYTGGYSGYKGYKFSVEYSTGNYYLGGFFDTYKGDNIDRYNSYGITSGFDNDNYSLNFELSYLPETGGYSNKSVYGDFSYNLIQDETSILSFLSIGPSFTFTSHSDLYSSTSSITNYYKDKKDFSFTRRSSEFRLNQYDYGISMMMAIYGLRFFVSYTRTDYDKPVSDTDRPLPTDIGPTGYPKHSLSLNLRFSKIFLSPQIGYSITSYYLSQPDSKTFIFGLKKKIDNIELSGKWKIFDDGLNTRENYYSFGLGYSF